LKITFAKLMNELGCRDETDRHLTMPPVECPHCHKILNGKIYDNGGMPMAEIGGPCARLTFIIADWALNACFEKTYCPNCFGSFLRRMEVLLSCNDCGEDVRIGMISFDDSYISGFSVHCSGKNWPEDCFRISIRPGEPR